MPTYASFDITPSPRDYLTPEDVAKLAAAATRGPWLNTSQSGEITDAQGYYIGRAVGAETRVGRANAAFIAAAHDMADLIAEQAREIAELRVQIEAADLMLSAGKAMAARLTHVVGPEGVVKHWDAIAATYRAARGQK